MIALLMLLATASSAADAEVDADLRCVAILNAAVARADGDERTTLVKGAWYYIGRIDARRSGYDYVTELTALATGKTGPMPNEADFNRCAKAINARGEDLQRVGQALRDLGAKARGETK